jgi:hypothetical protein
MTNTSIMTIVERFAVGLLNTIALIGVPLIAIGVLTQTFYAVRMSPTFPSIFTRGGCRRPDMRPREDSRTRCPGNGCTNGRSTDVRAFPLPPRSGSFRGP